MLGPLRPLLLLLAVLLGPGKGEQSQKIGECPKLILNIPSPTSAIVHDETDSIVGPLIKALNISLTYYKDVYNIRAPIDLFAHQMTENTTLQGTVAARAKCAAEIGQGLEVDDLLF